MGVALMSHYRSCHFSLTHMQDFLHKYSDSKYEFSDSAINFGRHKILECAREIYEKSSDTTLDKDSFIRISDDLEGMLVEVSGRGFLWLGLIGKGVV